MRKPFFSVCIPCNNREDTILETLRSVNNQRFRDFELVVIDYGSKDSSREIIKSFLESNGFRNNTFEVIYKEIDKELVTVEDWNSPLEYASGRYIAMLEGDDQFLPDHLYNAHEYLKENPNVGIYCTSSQIGNLNQDCYYRSKDYFFFIYSLKQVPPPSQIIFIRDNYQGVKYVFNTKDFNYAPEIDLCIRIANAGYDAFYARESSVYRRISSPKRRPKWIKYLDNLRVLDMYKDIAGTSNYQNVRIFILKRAINDYLKFLAKGIRVKIFESGIKNNFKIIEFVWLLREWMHKSLLNKLKRPLLKINFFSALKRLRLIISIMQSRKAEPLVSNEEIRSYYWKGNMFPTKKYFDFTSNFTIVRRGNFRCVEYKNDLFYYPQHFDESLVERNFNSILNEQTKDFGNKSPHQYFDTEEISKDWIIYDLGCAEGLQSKTWIKKAKHIVIFEPDRYFFESLKLTFQDEIDAGKVTLINYGLSNRQFEIEGTGNNMKFDTLDQLILDYRLPLPDYIKADIEGEELNFIQGASGLFSNKPPLFLQITVYHRPQDYLDIPSALRKFSGDGELSEGIMKFNRNGMIHGSSKEPFHPVFRKCLYTHKFVRRTENIEARA